MAIEIQSMTPLLEVYDMRRSLAFYCEQLGFRVMNSQRYWALLELSGWKLMLNAKYEDDKRPDDPPEAPRQDVVFYCQCQDVDAVHALLKEQGLDPPPPKTSDYGMKQIFLRDPDGFQICFQQPVE